MCLGTSILVDQHPWEWHIPQCWLRFACTGVKCSPRCGRAASWKKHSIVTVSKGLKNKMVNNKGWSKPAFWSSTGKKTPMMSFIGVDSKQKGWGWNDIQGVYTWICWDISSATSHHVCTILNERLAKLWPTTTIFLKTKTCRFWNVVPMHPWARQKN